MTAHPNSFPQRWQRWCADTQAADVTQSLSNFLSTVTTGDYFLFWGGEKEVDKKSTLGFSNV